MENQSINQQSTGLLPINYFVMIMDMLLWIIFSTW